MHRNSVSFLDVPDQTDVLHQKREAKHDDRVELPGGTFCGGDDIPLPPGTFHAPSRVPVDDRDDLNPPLRTPA